MEFQQPFFPKITLCHFELLPPKKVVVGPFCPMQYHKKGLKSPEAESEQGVDDGEVALQGEGDGQVDGHHHRALHPQQFKSTVGEN